MNEPDTETPFEQRLLDDLETLRASLPAAVAAAAGTSTPSYLISSRRLFVVIAIVGAAAAAVAAAIIISGQGSSRSAAPVPKTAKELGRRMLLAVSDSSDQILYELSTRSELQDPAGPNPTVVPTGHSEEWEDLTTGKSREIMYDTSGRPEFESTSETSGRTWTISSVLYGARTWTSTSNTLPGATTSPGGAAGLAGLYRGLVGRGIFKLVGRGTIGGVGVLHLHQARLPQPAGFGMPSFSVDLWVDASTYLPVLQETSTGGRVTNRTTYSWLPRTPENLAKLSLVVPPGFTHSSRNSTSFIQTWSRTTTTSHP